MAQDKKKGVPTPKTKKLTKSQNTLFDTIVKEAEEGYKRIMDAVQMEMNKPLMARVDMTLTIFKEELGIPEDWLFDDRKRLFTEPKKKPTE